MKHRENLKIIESSKFITLSILTFGLYEIWWIYKSWRFFNHKDNLSVNAALKTMFSIFYLLPLIQKIKNYSIETGVKTKYSSLLLFAGYITIELIGFVSESIWLISVFSFIFLIQPLKAIQQALIKDQNYSITQLTKFNLRQKFLIGIGILWWIIVGLDFILMNQENTEYVTIGLNNI